MTRNANDPRHGQGAGDRGSLADGGGLGPIVAAIVRRREAAEKGAPLDCGHADTTRCRPACLQAEQRRAPVARRAAAAIDRAEHGDQVQAWAEARMASYAEGFPRYASRAWRELHPDDPRRLGGVLEAAENWRKYGDEEDLLAWLIYVNRARDPITAGKTRAEYDAAAAPKPAHQLRATPGWPPIRVPGQPGRYLAYTEGRAAA